MSREIAVLTNPTAGRGRSAAAAGVAVARFQDAGLRVHRIEGRDAEEAVDLTCEAVQRGVGTVVVAGGDGTIQLALRALVHTPTALGVIPTGTGNDAARLLGVPLGDPVAAADIVIASRVRTVDVGRCGAAYFLCVLSAGFDAVVSERANRMAARGGWPRGQWRYPVATLAELRVFAPIPYVLELDGNTTSMDAMLVAVGNGPSFGGGLRITEGARVDDGLLDVVLFHPVPRRELLRTYPKLFRGTHTTHPAYEHHRVREVTVAAPGVVAYADGERLGPLPVTVTSEPAALRVLVGPGGLDHRGAA